MLIPKLFDCFAADLIVRPLLVEASLASRETPDGLLRWAVMVDQDKFPFTESQILGESAASLLPSRLRNTLAHELAHSFSFRLSEFGITIRRGSSEQLAPSLVKELEAETEKLSPALLIPQSTLEEIFPWEVPKPTLTNIAALRQRLGVSREVFVNRIRLIRELDEDNLLSRPALKNMALGIYSGKATTTVFSDWPLFRQFGNSSTPEVILKIIGGTGDIMELFGEATTGRLVSESHARVDLHVGTARNRRIATRNATIDLEPMGSSRSAKRLFLLRLEDGTR